MSDNETYIKKFLSGSMSTEEEKEFKSRLDSDDELYAEYLLETKGKTYIKARAMLEEIENDPDLPKVQAEVDAYMESIRNEKDSGMVRMETQDKISSRTKKDSLKLLLWSVPAAMFIGVLLIFRLYMRPDPNVRLYNQFYNPPSEEVFYQGITRSETKASLFEGIQYYLEGDYMGAIQLLEKIPEGSFVLGLSQLGMGLYQDAQVSFKRFYSDHPDHPDVLWYLGLSCLRTGDINAAKSYLTRLTQIPSSHRQQTELLISKINKMGP